MRELSLDHLRTLTAIADLGSLAAAGQALHLSPATVTVHVADLEARLGGKLLARGRGPAVPTPLGQRFIERARRILAESDAAVEDVRRQLAGQSGAVRVGASTGVLAHLLPPVLARLAKEHPGIDVQLAVLTSTESMARVAAGTLDVGIVALPQPARAGVRLTPLRRDPILAFVPAGWSPPARVTPQWLADRPLILNDASTSLFRQTAEWFAAAGVHCRARIEMNYGDAARTLVAAAYGATLLPQEGQAPAADARVAVRPLKPALWRQLAIATREEEGEGPLRFVLAALAQAAGDLPMRARQRTA